MRTVTVSGACVLGSSHGGEKPDSCGKTLIRWNRPPTQATTTYLHSAVKFNPVCLEWPGKPCFNVHSTVRRGHLSLLRTVRTRGPIHNYSD
ncbi:hypothetical protein BaRGS_00015558 [Batillaria attramentaria]|uniref:Uncharacterized protein n=1 Tax=Batillaria attramentaria TaxID=370345 RepID=A0ABD0L1U1_9CAEN